MILLMFAALAQDWPTLHRDAQRSGFVDEALKGPFERKWFRDFHDEMIASRVEAIVAEGKCFVGTFAGKLHALRVEDGSTAWTFQAQGPIGHSPEYRDGLLYVGADDGRLYALKASDGGLVWTYEAGAGLWASPLCAGSRVCVGDRAGVFHAVDAKNGARAWTFATGGMILKTASLSPDGKTIVLASEDMHAYALSPEGRLLWKSAKMAGVSARDQAPTIWKGLAIVRTAPADGFHEVMNRNQDLLARTQKTLPLGPDDKVIDDKHGAYILRYRAERVQAEQDAVVRYLRENPHDRTFYAFGLEDGAEPWIAPVFYTSGLHNPATPPTFDPRTGDCYTFHRSSLTNYSRGVRPFTALGRLDRETGRLESVRHAHGDEPGWSDFATIGDETQSLSLAGGILLSTHQGTIGGLLLDTRKWFPIHNGRDTYAGIYGPGAHGGWDAEKRLQKDGFLVNMPNEWHGPDKSILAIAGGRMFWLAGSQVVCWGGPGIPKAGTGGTKAPPPIKKRFERVVTAGGNVTAGRVGGFDPSLARLDVPADAIDRLPASGPPAPSPLRAKLDAAVLELIDGGPWAPFIVELGISREERHFARTGDTMRILSLALPHLSDGVRARARTHLDALWMSGAPLEKPLHAADGKRRELYDLGPGMRKFAAAETPAAASLEDLYAVWAYAHHAGAWEKVLLRKDRIVAMFESATRAPVRFDPAEKRTYTAERLNAEFAGVLGFLRLASRAGLPADRAAARLRELAAERLHHERSDSNFIRESARGAHSATIPRYVELTPELPALLASLGRDAFARNLRDLTQQLPLWHQAFGERMAGGENYTHTPHIARGLFLALADGGLAAPEQLAAKLDQPWCRADLYHIEKLTALLRRLDAPR